MTQTVQVRRIYDEVEDTDGRRVLVDRLWPRGMSKVRAKLTLWCRDVAPTPQLRQWYAHDPAKFDEFAARYRAELSDEAHAEALSQLRQWADDDEMLTLLTAAKRDDISEATVLRQVLIGAVRDGGSDR